MFTKSLHVIFIGLICFTATAWAGKSLQGVVTDAAGRPVKGAQIRIEPRNGGKLVATTKTDANGRYLAANLPAGVYRVTLLVDGAVRGSISNATIRANEPTELNFLQPTRAAQPASQSKTQTVSRSDLQRQIPSSNARGLEDDWARRWIWSTR